MGHVVRKPDVTACEKQRRRPACAFAQFGPSDFVVHSLEILVDKLATRTNSAFSSSRLGMSVTTQGGSGRQCVTGPGRNIPKYRFVSLNVYRFWET